MNKQKSKPSNQHSEYKSCEINDGWTRPRVVIDDIPLKRENVYAAFLKNRRPEGF